MEYVRSTAGLLASVTDDSEARLCASLGADVIDAKNPSAGALGALPLATIAAIRAATPCHVPVSATIGDPTEDLDAMVRIVEQTAEAGVEFVKVGLSIRNGAIKLLEALRHLDLGQSRLVGVLLVDEGFVPSLVCAAKGAGFAGLMLDTADKQRGALPDLLPARVLRDFVAAAHEQGMFAGLAGSLRACHVPYLLGFEPDLLGFRGGLCREGARTDAIDPDAVRMLRRIVPSGATRIADACRAGRTGAMAPRQREGVA